jgi:cytochrome c-type biogenesis protein CcmH
MRNASSWRTALAGLGALICIAAAPTAAEEERARALFKEIRCVVCQNESIDSSQAEIATDLRGVVREQIAAGRSDDEVRAFLVERYGDFVLFRPAFSPGNAILWLTPFAIVLGGLAVVSLRGNPPQSASPLSAEETARVRALQPPEPNDGEPT